MLVVQLQNGAILSIRQMITSLPSIFTLVTQQPFEVMAFSLGMFHTLGVALCWCLFHLHS